MTGFVVLAGSASDSPTIISLPVRGPTGGELSARALAQAADMIRQWSVSPPWVRPDCLARLWPRLSSICSSFLTVPVITGDVVAPSPTWQPDRPGEPSRTKGKGGDPEGSPSILGSAIFGWSLGLVGPGGLVQELELVGAGYQVVLGVLAPFGVGPLVERQAGGCLEEATVRAVAGDELSRLLPGFQVDEDCLV